MNEDEGVWGIVEDLVTLTKDRDLLWHLCMKLGEAIGAYQIDLPNKRVLKIAYYPPTKELDSLGFNNVSFYTLTGFDLGHRKEVDIIPDIPQPMLKDLYNSAAEGREIYDEEQDRSVAVNVLKGAKDLVKKYK